MKKAFLILEDGHVFTGMSIGADGEMISEIVFNTSMTGYLEVMTDPSYAGQAVVMTWPLIGNYGICLEDMESERPWVDGLIVREFSDIPSNFRSEGTIQQFLKENKIPALSGVDTRAITRLLREHGTMNGMITTCEPTDIAKIIDRLKAYQPMGGVKKTTAAGIYEVNPEGKGQRAAVWDLGAKDNIVRSLVNRDCRVTVYPCTVKADEIIGSAPDGIMLTNGPGDPKELTDIIPEIRKIYDTEIPVFAICLGHQLMALATGADTRKMKYGHRGGNHPVRELATGRIYISSQNHGYVVDQDTVDATVASPSFQNVNDGTNEGLSYAGKKILTVQFHPEACPGPQDTNFLFDRFMKMMEG